ncbi:MAG TPA: hypothetical protein PKC49_08665 [Phycisphaerae bacterium]|nr:hypothetical protein [Phycisphaerae bacterium]
MRQRLPAWSIVGELPATCHLEIPVIPEHQGAVEGFCGRPLIRLAGARIRAIERTDDQVDFFLDRTASVFDHRQEQRFDFGALADHEFAGRTDAARLVEHANRVWLDVNDERQLSLLRLRFALGTARESHVRVRIEKEEVSGSV